MGGLLFVAHDILDTWAGQGKIDLAGNLLTVLGGAAPARAYRLEAAVRFLKVVGAERDPHGLLRRVKSEARLRALGAEILPGAVVLGEVAYEVEPGFLAEAEVLEAAAAAPPGERTP